MFLITVLYQYYITKIRLYIENGKHISRYLPSHCTIKDYKQQAATHHLDALLLFFCRFYLRIFIDAARRSMNN